VSRSSTICEIATFMTLVSSTITNCAEASMMSGIHFRTVGRGAYPQRGSLSPAQCRGPTAQAWDLPRPGRPSQ
jgi:hypothetical protein